MAEGADGAAAGPPAEQPALPAGLNWLLRLLQPGSSLNHYMWAFLNGIFGVLFLVIVWMYYVGVGGVHTLVFGGLFLGLVLSANWLFYEVMAAKKIEEEEKKES
eukprot:TRINITY_DN2138_c0_g1_i1.p1 TRINITY_DN2138_c0_g1~~TRINITY_DN2138_c0_g1_i1.p1  ORF type:complete len:120 (-),score=56.71 TRINITY_DN2138_c0_g1_i1:21-332(-)